MTMVITGNSTLQTEVEDLCDVNMDACIQCGTCTGGCSGIELMEYGPRQIIQLIKLNQRKILLDSRARVVIRSFHFEEHQTKFEVPFHRFKSCMLLWMLNGKTQFRV